MGWKKDNRQGDKETPWRRRKKLGMLREKPLEKNPQSFSF